MKIEGREKRYLFLGLLGLLLTVAIIYYAGIQWGEAREAAMFSCVSSIHAALISMGDEKSAEITAHGVEWRVLSNTEKSALLSSPSIIRRLDCHNFKSDAPHIHIAVRRRPQEQQAEFIVWFDGADGVAGTSDDVSSIPGATVPPTP